MKKVKDESNQIKQHIPNFVDLGDEPPPVVKFNTLDELLNIDFVKQWSKPPTTPQEVEESRKLPFYRFSVERIGPNHYTLMVEKNRGRWWWVIGYMKRDMKELPDFQPVMTRRGD